MKKSNFEYRNYLWRGEEKEAWDGDHAFYLMNYSLGRWYITHDPGWKSYSSSISFVAAINKNGNVFLRRDNCNFKGYTMEYFVSIEKGVREMLEKDCFSRMWGEADRATPTENTDAKRIMVGGNNVFAGECIMDNRNGLRVFSAFSVSEVSGDEVRHKCFVREEMVDGEVIYSVMSFDDGVKFFVEAGAYQWPFSIERS